MLEHCARLKFLFLPQPGHSCGKVPAGENFKHKNAKELDKEEAVEQLGQVLGVGVNNWQPAKDLRSKGKVHQFSAHSQPKNPKKPQVSIG